MKGEIFSFLPLRLCSFASLRETKLRSVTPIPPQSVTVIKEMINMVRKGGTSLKHFALTAVGLLSVLVGLAYLTR
jgi:hypothetical protein